MMKKDYLLDPHEDRKCFLLFGKDYDREIFLTERSEILELHFFLSKILKEVLDEAFENSPLKLGDKKNGWNKVDCSGFYFSDEHGIDIEYCYSDKRHKYYLRFIGPQVSFKWNQKGYEQLSSLIQDLSDFINDYL